jgi:hypothetical protein
LEAGVRVIAAKFPDWSRASAALSSLQRRLTLSPRDAAIAPLGTPGERSEGQALLAGRFADSQATVVAEAVRAAGGEVVADVDERWTLPRAQPTSGPVEAIVNAATQSAQRRRRTMHAQSTGSR